MNKIETRIGTNHESILMKTRTGHSAAMAMGQGEGDQFSFLFERYTPKGRVKSRKRVGPFKDPVECKRWMIHEADDLNRRGYVRVEA